MKKFIITEEERKYILERHRSYGYKTDEIEEDLSDLENTEPQFDDLLDMDSELETDRDDLEQS